jgi:Xaa-Pro aminopeptidase
VAEEVAQQSEDPPDAPTRQPLETGRHDLPVSAALDAFMREGWAAREPVELRPTGMPGHCAARRARLSAYLPGERLVVPAGEPRYRGNGQEHRFRPASDYVYLTGDRSLGGVLLLEPDGDGHRASLFLRPPSGRDSRDFFRDHRHGELWVGRRAELAESEAALGIRCRPLDELAEALAASVPTRCLRGVDAEVDALAPPGGDPYPDAELKALLSELRLVKDAWEVMQIEAAVGATIRGFEDVVRRLPEALRHGERYVEGVMALRARLDGNDTAFNPIVACGAHATILHWRDNGGALRPEELLLLDAGVESHTLYAADLTRTFPVSGAFTPVQRRMLELVNAAHESALAAIRPGCRFRDFHTAADAALAEGLAGWGLLPVSAAESLREDAGLHRRFTLCAPGHMLGLDVHDCAHARAERYLDGLLEPGNVLTVEPGLYFQADDVTLPEELRGVGVRIEDDVVVTETGCRVLSEQLPRRPDEIEAWMAGLRRE